MPPSELLVVPPFDFLVKLEHQRLFTVVYIEEHWGLVHGGWPTETWCMGPRDEYNKFLYKVISILL